MSETRGPIRVVLAEDHATVRQGLKMLIDGQPDMVVIGEAGEAVIVSERLAREGLLVPAIRPPTVPRGTARLRISLSADHELPDVERLAAALNRIENSR